MEFTIWEKLSTEEKEHLYQLYKIYNRYVKDASTLAIIEYYSSKLELLYKLFPEIIEQHDAKLI